MVNRCVAGHLGTDSVVPTGRVRVQRRLRHLTVLGEDRAKRITGYPRNRLRTNFACLLDDEGHDLRLIGLARTALPILVSLRGQGRGVSRANGRSAARTPRP
jgi:hypothetical protein